MHLHPAASRLRWLLAPLPAGDDEALDGLQTDVFVEAMSAVRTAGCF